MQFEMPKINRNSLQSIRTGLTHLSVRTISFLMIYSRPGGSLSLFEIMKQHIEYPEISSMSHVFNLTS